MAGPASGVTPLTVALDATPLLGPRTGIGEVVAGILSPLAARPDLRIRAYALTLRGRRALAAELPPGVEPATRAVPARWVRRRWHRADRPRIERWAGGVDVVHATNYVAPPADAPVLVSVYDLTVVRFPELCAPDTLEYPALLRRALARGATLHAPSTAIAEELVDALGAPSDRVVTVPLGLPEVGGGAPRRGHRLAGADRYVLALGTIEPRKNLPALVAAFDAIADAHPEVHLVHAGGDGWDEGAFDLAVTRSSHRARIRRLGYVDPATRADLLAGATVFAYPSRYEGFGFPPLEAMAVGVPVVATAVGSLPEVLGDAAHLVPDDDVAALAGALEVLLTDEAGRAARIESGHARAARYSWASTADALATVYRGLAR
ncbi:MAG: glycosyltransferase family 4 protein [Actinomycetes bacterium]